MIPGLESMHKKLTKMIKGNASVFAMSLEALIAIALFLGAVRLVIGQEAAQKVISTITGKLGEGRDFAKRQFGKLTGFGSNMWKKTPEGLQKFVGSVGKRGSGFISGVRSGAGSIWQRGLYGSAKDQVSKMSSGGSSSSGGGAQ